MNLETKVKTMTPGAVAAGVVDVVMTRVRLTLMS
jgi:hypothetical protein